MNDWIKHLPPPLQETNIWNNPDFRAMLVSQFMIPRRFFLTRDKAFTPVFVPNDWFTHPVWISDFLRRKRHIRRLLNIDDDLLSPGWVRHTHEMMIDNFGTGNGRNEQS